MKRQTVNDECVVHFDDERTSRREQNGVTIMERETKRSIRFENGAYKNSDPTGQPQLVISDAVNRSKQFLSKSRTQLGEIDSFIRNITRRTVQAK